MSTINAPSPAHRHSPSPAVHPAGATPRKSQNQQHYNRQAVSNNMQSTVNYRQPTTPPRTPRRMAGSEQVRNTEAESAPESAAKPKSRGKNRAKNPSTTPAGPRFDRGTPPVRGIQSAGQSRPMSTPTAVAAYAGPTFHASPAPSALPIPSFYSKSVPESPSVMTSRIDNDNSSGNNSPTPPVAKPLITESQRQESPLDFFFNADREERARARSANSTAATGPFRPPADSPKNGVVTPGTNGQDRSRPSYQTSTSGSSGMFAMELDGNSGKPFGPAFSTPYKDRINAARSTSSQNSPQATTVEQQQATDRSEALKSFLFQSRGGPSTRPNNAQFPGENITPPNQNAQRASSHGSNNTYGSPQGRHGSFPYINEGPSGPGNGMRNMSRSSGLRQEVTPTKTPIPTPERMDGPSQFQQSPFRNFKENTLSNTNVLGNNFTYQQAPSGAAVPQSAPASQTQNSDIRNMEDSLRRILKLEPGGSGVFNAGGPAGSASISGYDGGRSTSFGGVNGVMGN